MRRTKDKSPSFGNSVISYMESLMGRRLFSEAVTYFEAQASLLEHADEPTAGRLLALASRTYVSLANYPLALRHARKAQALLSAEGDSESLAELFITLGLIFRDTAKLKEAERAFRDAESIFRRSDIAEGQSRALNQLAGIRLRQRDYRGALNHLMDAVDIAHALNDQKKIAFMMGNIGRIHTFLGNFAEGEKHLKINVQVSSELDDNLETARAQLSLGYLYTQSGAYNYARKSFEEARDLIAACGARREEVMRLTYLGELLYRCDELTESRRTLEKAIELAEDIAPGSTLSARAMRHLAECLVREGNLRTAGRLVAKSRKVYAQSDDKAELGALLKLDAQIAAASNKEKEARELFLEAIDVLDQSGIRFEKYDAMLSASRSQVFRRARRLAYLYRVEEFFVSQNLTTRLQPVQRLLAELSEQTVASSRSRKIEGPETVDYLTASKEIQRIKAQLPMLAKADLPILITGETGVGKDHMARYFHSLVRPDGPMVAINCASVPEGLLESELFGHRRGSFTGADRNKTGLFVAADKGVLFLDEIGDMPLVLQAKLLGVLERRAVLPLGDTKEVPIDVILVAATNHNLEEMVEKGLFRRDLYYRLSGICYRLPALRDRREDIPLLIDHFMKCCGMNSGSDALPAEVVRQFMLYDWPGNVRELANKVKRLQVMAELAAEGDYAEIALSIFPTDQQTVSHAGFFERIEEFERQLITEALMASGGNKSRAARILGIHEATVRTKLKRYGIDIDEVTSASDAPN